MTEAFKSASEHFFKGLRALNDGDLNRAEMNLVKALELVPDRPSVLANLSIVYTRQNKLVQALDLARRALEKDANEPLYWLQSGAVQLKSGDHEGALSSLARALEGNPSLAEAHCNRGAALKELARLDEALASYEEAIRLKPDYAEAYSNRGVALKELDRPDEALASFDKAIALKPDCAEAHTNRGYTLMDLNRLEDALASHEEAIRLKTDYAEAHCNRGIVLKELNRPDEALASYDKAIGLSKHATAYAGKGWVYCGFEDWQSAIASFEAALHHEPANNLAVMGLSLLPPGLVSGDRLREMLEILGAGWKDDAQMLFTKANLLARLGHHVEAFSCLTKANEKRLIDGRLKSNGWKEDFDLLSREVKSWNPARPQTASLQQKLLIILGPSRSGKTTLERMLCRDLSFFRGFESCRAGQAVRSLRSLAREIRQNAKADSHYPALLEILFPANGKAAAQQRYRVLTITNPFLLPAVPAIADVHEDAYFVFVHRDKIDNAAEIFAKDYSDRPSYAYHAGAALEYVGRYNQIANQLALKLGRRALEVRFEEVLQTPGKILSDVHALVGVDPCPDVSDGLLTEQSRSPESSYREQFLSFHAG